MNYFLFGTILKWGSKLKILYLNDRLLASFHKFLKCLVVTLLPEEWLSHSVISWLSAPLSFIVPSIWTDWSTSVNSDSLKLNSANFSELASSLFTGFSRSFALLSTGEGGSGFLFWLDAMVVIFGVSFWTFHGAMTASYSLEELITFGLEGSWGNLLAIVVSVSSFASGLGWGKVQFASGNLSLDGGREVVVLSQKGFHVV